MDIIYRIKSRLEYALKAHYRQGHWVHSPFTYHMLNCVIFEKHPYYSFPYIEQTRKTLLNNNKIIHLKALGPSDARTTTIAKETKRSTKSPRQAQLLQRLCASNNAKYIIELGTNVGLSTLYLAYNDSKSTVWTFEGQHELINIAKQNIKKHGISNIKVIEGNIDTTFYDEINKIPQIDLIFIDANHRYKPTISYYKLAKTKAVKNSIFIIDDIHHSPEMQKAWDLIRADKDVRLSIDIYSMGIIWFNTDITKHHYIVAF